MDTPSFSDFESSGQAVLRFLHRRLGFDLWMVTRNEGDECIVLQTKGGGYAIAPGAVIRWPEAFTSEMLKGNGTYIAPQLNDVTASVLAPAARQVEIRACIGQSLMRADASLFGCLCAADPLPQPVSIVEEQELVELLGGLLSSILQTELRVAEQTRLCERLQAEALTDSLTSLYNLRGWNRLLASEEERCRRYGHGAAVLVVDLDGLKHVNDSLGHAAGDQLIVGAALALRKAARSLDVVARFGGDEFGILSAECDECGGKALLQRARASLEEVGIKASIGLAMRDPSVGLLGACRTADRNMYEEKRREKGTTRPLVNSHPKSTRRFASRRNCRAMS